MKNGKRATRNQKHSLIAAGKSPNSWLVVKSINEELHLVHIETGRTAVIPK